jgi:hypothetical protein
MNGVASCKFYEISAVFIKYRNRGKAKKIEASLLFVLEMASVL